MGKAKSEKSEKDRLDLETFWTYCRKSAWDGWLDGMAGSMRRGLIWIFTAGCGGLECDVRRDPTSGISGSEDRRIERAVVSTVMIRRNFFFLVIVLASCHLLVTGETMRWWRHKCARLGTAFKALSIV